ncbi:hypothetical protein Leryth_008855 [Lithospermum erythrorhizon]|nr:hypothetical protein Leryth_008855 [Lithospermum erythrorhizon]
MEFQLKQWREEQEQQNHSKQQHPHSAKLPRLFLDSYNTNKTNNNNTIANQSEQEESGLVLPLFAPDQPTSKICNINMSGSYLPDSTAVTATKCPRMGSYFSLAQWQELELQALIFRHMLAGSPVPPELLHLVKKSLIASSAYYLPHNIQHHPYFHHSKPGRCRRTDGKKWRCSRDIVPGHKYCERHVHRGKNRSRKPVENPTPTATSTGGNAGGGLDKTNNVAAASGSMAHSGVSIPTRTRLDNISIHLNERLSEQPTSLKNPFENQSRDYPNDGKTSARILRPFFDDWPKSLQESDNVGSNISPVTSTTHLSISTIGNSSSDFSLKLSTGANINDTDHPSQGTEGDQHQSQWNVPPWGTSQVASMGGPLAEALRSSNDSSPTSDLFQLTGRTRSHASYVSS